MSKIEPIDQFRSGAPWEGDAGIHQSASVFKAQNKKIKMSLFGRWRQRARSRAALRRLDDQLLRDIGLSREEASREARKPFWKP